MGHAIRISYASRKAVWITKLCARIVAAVASLGLLAFTAQHITSLKFDPHEYNTSDYMQAIIAEILATLSTAFNLSEITCLAAFRGHRGVSPGALAVGDLVFFALLVLANLLRNACGSEWCKPSIGYDGDPRASGGPFDIRGVPFWFGTILSVLHFILFIAATAEALARSVNTTRVVVDRGDQEAAAFASQLQQAILHYLAGQNNKGLAHEEGVPLGDQEMAQEEGIKEKRPLSEIS